MERHSVVGDRDVSQPHLLLSLSLPIHTQAKCTSMYTLAYKDVTRPYMCTTTHMSWIVFASFSQSLLYPFLSLSYLFSLGLAEIVCSFNVSPPDRKDLNSPPVHTNKRARILLTPCRSALPFMTVGLKKRLLLVDPTLPRTLLV